MNSDDLMGLIRSRRSVRTFDQEQPVTKEEIQKILEAGIWAPTGTNQQELRFAM